MPSQKSGPDEGGREDLVGMAASAFGFWGCREGVDYSILYHTIWGMAVNIKRCGGRFKVRRTGHKYHKYIDLWTYFDDGERIWIRNARERRDQGIDPQLLFPSGRVPPAALLRLALGGGNRRGKLQEVQLARIS